MDIIVMFEGFFNFLILVFGVAPEDIDQWTY